MFIATMKQAKRLIKIVIGFTLLLLGVIMLVTPGPGWLTIAAALAILAAEFVWARRLLNKIKEKGIQIRDAVWTPAPAKSPQAAPATPQAAPATPQSSPASPQTPPTQQS